MSSTSGSERDSGRGRVWARPWKGPQTESERWEEEKRSSPCGGEHFYWRWLSDSRSDLWARSGLWKACFRVRALGELGGLGLAILRILDSGWPFILTLWTVLLHFGARNGAVAQLVRVLDCRSSGCGFESRPPRLNTRGPSIAAGAAFHFMVPGIRS